MLWIGAKLGQFVIVDTRPTYADISHKIHTLTILSIYRINRASNQNIELHPLQRMDVSAEIRKMFGYDRRKFVDEDDNCDDMEAGFSEVGHNIKCCFMQGYLKQKDGPFPGFSLTLLSGPTHHHHH